MTYISKGLPRSGGRIDWEGGSREDSLKRVCSPAGDIDCCLDLGGDNGHGER